MSHAENQIIYELIESNGCFHISSFCDQRAYKICVIIHPRKGKNGKLTSKNYQVRLLSFNHSANKIRGVQISARGDLLGQDIQASSCFAISIMHISYL